VEGLLVRENFDKSQEVRDRLIHIMAQRKGAIYMDAMISPSVTSALAQSLQMPGISGMENNTSSSSTCGTTPPRSWTRSSAG
jgi:hypothetical protein